MIQDYDIKLKTDYYFYVINFCLILMKIYINWILFNDINYI